MKSVFPLYRPTIFFHAGVMVDSELLYIQMVKAYLDGTYEKEHYAISSMVAATMSLEHSEEQRFRRLPSAVTIGHRLERQIIDCGAANPIEPNIFDPSKWMVRFLRGSI